VTRRRLSKGLLAWALLTLLAGLGAYARAHVSAAEPPPQAAVTWALAALDAAAQGHAPEAAPASASAYRPDAPVYIVGWSHGAAIYRLRHEGLATAVAQAASELRARPDAGSLKFTLSVSLGSGPMTLGVPWLSELGLVPRRDGLELRFGDDVAFLTPDELMADGDFDPGAIEPMPELSFGVRVGALSRRLAGDLGRDPADAPRGDLRRFVAVTYSDDVYPRDRPATEANLLEAAHAGAAFLLRHQGSDGRYVYEYDGATGLPRNSGYNLPRHAGTTYFLAQEARVAGDEAARLGARRALGYIEQHLIRHCGAPERLCVADSPRADVGASALTAVAAAEYLRGRNDVGVRRLLEGLMTFLRAQQRPDGEMMHEFDLAAGQPIDVQYLYYSGEAAYALLLAYDALHDARDLEAAKRVMAHLTGSGWDFLGSRYYYGAEHWTCIAAGVGRDEVDSPEALDFCGRWADWNANLQYRDGETAWHVTGSFGVSPFIAPRFTPVGSRSEAFIATYRLFKARGQSTEQLRPMIERGMESLMRWQWRPGPTHLLADPAGAEGGFPGSPLELLVRNDYVQHSGSALLAWVEVLREERGVSSDGQAASDIARPGAAGAAGAAVFHGWCSSLLGC